MGALNTKASLAMKLYSYKIEYHLIYNFVLGNEFSGIDKDEDFALPREQIRYILDIPLINIIFCVVYDMDTYKQVLKLHLVLVLWYK